MGSQDVERADVVGRGPGVLPRSDGTVTVWKDLPSSGRDEGMIFR